MTKENFITNEPLSNFIKLRQLDQYMIGHKGYIAGGVFKNIFNNERYKDVDVFFENEKDHIEAEEYFKNNDDYIFRYKNDKVVAYKNKNTNVTVELIKHKYRSPLDMIDEFDFTITKFVYYKEFADEDEIEEDILPVVKLAGEVGEAKSVEWKVAYHNKFFEHLHMKRLVVDEGLVLPVNTFNRMFRYAKYGYFPCRETKAKLIAALRDLPNFSEELLGMELYNGLD